MLRVNFNLQNKPAIPSEQGKFIKNENGTQQHDYRIVLMERGGVQSRWERQGKVFTLEVEVPVGAEAEVHVPASDARDVMESGVPAAQASVVRYLGRRDRTEVFHVGGDANRSAAVKN